MEITAWLRDLGLERYVQAFLDAEVTPEILTALTDADLRELGLPLGPRKVVIKAIEALANPPAASLSGNEQEVAAPRPPPTAHEAERRHLTVMFCDLIGSTALAARLDPEDLQDRIGTYHRFVDEIVEQFGGFVAKYMGDGVLAYFGYPQSNEDDAERAVRAGLSIVRGVAQLPTPEPLEVRIGIGTGLVVVGDLLGSGEARERSVVGETPNLAARLQSLADRNAVVIGPSTRQLLGDLFEYRSLGDMDVKGFAEPVQAYQVLGSSSVESRFEALHASALTPLIGRDDELEILRRGWQRAKSGNGQVMLLSGEPGIGKSRLTAEILEQIAGEPHTRLRYFCSPHHADSAYSPIINQLERAAAFARDDDVAEKFEKLDALLSRTSTSAEDRWVLADLLSLPDIGRYPALHLSPQQRKQKTFDALLRQLETLAHRQPVLMIFEDVHWIDPTSLEVMNATVWRVRHMPVLLLFTFRPEFKPAWVGEHHVTMMALTRLDQTQGAALVEGLVGDKLPAEMVREIAERADGVPLFVEEMTKALLEVGFDGLEAAGLLSRSSSAAHALPATLQASLMARLDRLGPAKEVAQIGAVIGREFSYEVLAAVSSLSEGELRVAVDQLTASGLVFVGTSTVGSYLFKHALVQDAAYSTLLRRARQRLHGRIAEVLENRFPDQAAREPEMLAHHFAEAQQPDRAAAYWFTAGKNSAERSANLEAIRHLSRALESLKSLPEGLERDRQELAIQSAIGTPLIAVSGYAAPETGVAFSRALALGERLGDANAMFAALSGQWAFHFVRGDAAMMRELAMQARHATQQTKDEALELAGYRLSGLNAMYSGAFDEARSAFETILRIYDPGRHRPSPLHYIHDPKFYALAYLPVVYWIRGYPEQARSWQARSFQYASELIQATLAAHVRIYGGAGLDELLFDAAAVRAHADAIIEIADQHNLRYFRLSGQILKGWAMAQGGMGEEGLALMRRSATERLAMGVGWYQIRYMCMLAATFLQHGRADEGLVAMSEAKELVGRIDEHIWEAELERVEGELGRAVGASAADVETHFQAAVSIARGQNAKSFELRAAVSLARLWRDQDKRAEARDLLAPVYGWFTEGFDTPDLIEAKAILCGLSSS